MLFRITYKFSRPTTHILYFITRFCVRLLGLNFKNLETLTENPSYTYWCGSVCVAKLIPLLRILEELTVNLLPELQNYYN